MLKFLPKFNEKNADVFFSLFEKISEEITCDDQEAYIALSKPERRDYAIVSTHRSDGEIMWFNLLTQNLIKIEK